MTVATFQSMDTQTEETAGELVGSRHLDDPIRELDLETARQKAWAALDKSDTHHTARTLVKLPTLRVVLMVLRRGAEVPEHTAEGDVTLHVLRGRIGVRVDGQHKRLHAGQLISIERLQPHALEGLEESEVLLSLGWPP